MVKDPVQDVLGANAATGAEFKQQQRILHLPGGSRRLTE